MIRVAVLSDTHGQVDPRVAEVVAGCDLALHGGDLGGAQVLRSLQPRGGRVIAVAGNNDVPHKWPQADRDLLAQLPDLAELALPGGTLTLIHGHQVPARGRHARLRARYPGARMVVYGHSHRLVADLDAEPWVVNPGAAGHERTFGGPSCLVLTAGASAWSLELCRFEPGPRQAGPSQARRPRPA
jgi:putative phosphoesterase